MSISLKLEVERQLCRNPSNDNLSTIVWFFIAVFKFVLRYTQLVSPLTPKWFLKPNFIKFSLKWIFSAWWATFWTFVLIERASVACHTSWLIWFNYSWDNGWWPFLCVSMAWGVLRSEGDYAHSVSDKAQLYLFGIQYPTPWYNVAWHTSVIIWFSLKWENKAYVGCIVGLLHHQVRCTANLCPLCIGTRHKPKLGLVCFVPRRYSTW